MKNQSSGSINIAIFEAINQRMNRHGRDYLSMAEVKQLPKKVMDAASINKTMAVSKLAVSLRKILDRNNQFTLRTGYAGKTYLARNQPLKRFLLAKLQNKPTGLSPRQLVQHLPLKKMEAIEILNELMAKAEVITHLSTDYGLNLRVGPKPASHSATDEWLSDEKSVKSQPIPRKSPQSSNLGADIQAFRKVCEKMGHGQGFIRIHRVREDLGWESKRFDKTMLKLLEMDFIEIHGGDPSFLTPDEVAGSFRDHNGSLYVTMTWWGEA
ncbi:MAG: hypothetical protein HQL54_08940 [Magnetococcales bacterium]|nr:hypothetical protein [Magnetococcales bacterium]